jgi:hypothetical protein
MTLYASWHLPANKHPRHSNVAAKCEQLLCSPLLLLMLVPMHVLTGLRPSVLHADCTD